MEGSVPYCFIVLVPQPPWYLNTRHRPSASPWGIIWPLRALWRPPRLVLPSAATYTRCLVSFRSCCYTYSIKIREVHIDKLIINGGGRCSGSGRGRLQVRRGLGQLYPARRGGNRARRRGESRRRLASRTEVLRLRVYISAGGRTSRGGRHRARNGPMMLVGDAGGRRHVRSDTDLPAFVFLACFSLAGFNRLSPNGRK